MGSAYRTNCPSWGRGRGGLIWGFTHEENVGRSHHRPGSGHPVQLVLLLLEPQRRGRRSILADAGGDYCLRVRRLLYRQRLRNRPLSTDETASGSGCDMADQKKPKKKRAKTRWMTLPIPTTPVKLTSKKVFDTLQEQIDSATKPKTKKKKPQHRSIGDDWIVPW